MLNRIKEHIDHMHQSIFHHGLIKLIICTVLQRNNRIWDHFLFWSGFSNEQEDQVKKSLMNKQFGFVKRFNKELVDDLVQASVQENSPGQGFKELVDEEERQALDDKYEQVLENDKKKHRYVSNHEEELVSIKEKQGSICVQEITTKVLVVAEISNDTLQVSNVKFQRKASVYVKEVNWRMKTRVKNKLRLNMKKILNPKLRKEKITVIEDSTSEEDMEEEEDLSSQQFYIEKEHSMLLESFLERDKVSEDPITSSIERGMYSEVPVVQEIVKDKE